MPEAHEELLTAEEAAARLGVTRSYLYRLIKRGLLPEAIGIRGGREVKLIPASGLARLDAPEGLLVRDVDAPAEPLGAQRPVSDPPLTTTDRPVTPSDRPVTAQRPAAVAADRSVTGHPQVSEAQLLAVAELTHEVRDLRQELAEERAVRRRLEAQLAERPQPGDELATAISRANEVTALVKASELKQNRILESLLAQQRWGRAKRIAYAAYLVVTTAIAIGAAILIYQFAIRLDGLIPH